VIERLVLLELGSRGKAQLTVRTLQDIRHVASPFLCLSGTAPNDCDTKARTALKFKLTPVWGGERALDV
jgi:hypothetical protein